MKYLSKQKSISYEHKSLWLFALDDASQISTRFFVDWEIENELDGEFSDEEGEGEFEEGDEGDEKLDLENIELMDVKQEEKMVYDSKKGGDPASSGLTVLQRTQSECRKVYEKAWERLLRHTSDFPHDLKIQILK